VSGPAWIDLVSGRAGCPACEGFGYHEDGTEEGELCVVCDGRGVAAVEDAERWLAETAGLEG
jgi:RecJ-like exonuclease